ncbi:MAG: hypothetical protein AAGI48_03190 [Verrucomicrobiota bacterium]
MIFRSLLTLLSLLATLSPVRSEIDIDLPAVPTEVKVSIYIIDLIRINGSEQTFDVDFAVRVSWSDPRLAAPGKGKRQMPLDDVWHPKAAVINLRETTATQPKVVEVDEEGNVIYRQRIHGTYACPLDLRQFPRDEQELFLQVVASRYTPEEVKIIIDEERSGSRGNFTITDWEVGGTSVTAEPFTIPDIGKPFPAMRISLEAKRLTTYYVGTIYATVAIIGSMAWLVFWLPVGTIPPRVSMSVTSMLALIAYRFVAAQDLPRLPYLTRMDFFLVGAAFLILISLLGVVLIARRETGGDHEKALKLNRVFRWIYPTGFAVLLFAFG